jgi:hypothetical protein
LMQRANSSSGVNSLFFPETIHVISSLKSIGSSPMFKYIKFLLFKIYL